MEKKIKEYLPLYMGCQCLYETTGHISELKGIFNAHNGMWFTGVIYGLPEGNNTHWHPVESVKPLLRPLSSMTEEELKELEPMIAPDRTFTDKDREGAIKQLREKGIDAIVFDDNDPRLVFEVFRWLLSKHFDLFGLIESGLAIDSTKTQQS